MDLFGSSSNSECSKPPIRVFRCGTGHLEVPPVSHNSEAIWEEVNHIPSGSSRPYFSRPPFSRTHTGDSAYSQDTKEIRKLDRALEKELIDKEPPTTNETSINETDTTNPYQHWECGFGFTGPHDAPSEIPNTKAEFIQAVKGEISTISCIQNGLTSYLKAINSGVHHAFSVAFLKQQTDATHKTIGQLWQISSNLQDVVREVEHGMEDGGAVNGDLKKAYAHAQPWIKRTRAILVSAHVFYKINYVLGSDKVKHSK